MLEENPGKEADISSRGSQLRASQEGQEARKPTKLPEGGHVHTSDAELICSPNLIELMSNYLMKSVGNLKIKAFDYYDLFQTQLFAGNSMFFRSNSYNGCGLALGCRPLDTLGALALEHCSPGALLALGYLVQCGSEYQVRAKPGKTAKQKQATKRKRRLPDQVILY